MHYRQDKKNRRKKIAIRFFSIAILLFLVINFRTQIFNGMSYAAHGVFNPIMTVGKNLGNKFSSIGSAVSFKKLIIAENKDLKTQLGETVAKTANYNSILEENVKLKEILNRKQWNANLILGNILSQKNQSIYSSVLIDLGINDGIIEGQRVFAWGNIPIGKIAQVEANSSKVVLYSSPGERTEAIISGSAMSSFVELVGRGGGNFEIILPRDFVLAEGTEIVLPGAYPYLLGTVKTIISDPRDAFQKALIVSPVNVQELKFVEVER
jgi:cell shape-determining protein MreC